MITESKPIKRSKELAPLSREHHEGLLFVWKIKQGISHNIDPKRIAAFCLWFWKEHLQEHTAKEEALLTEILSVDHPAIAKMVDEHQAIKTLIISLQEYASYERLQRLATVVNYHIRFEERQLFKLIEQIATSSQLKEIEAGLVEERGDRILWTDEFWLRPKSPASNNFEVN